MTDVVYPRAVFHNGVAYNVVVTYHDQRAPQFAEDHFETAAGQEQMRKIQSLVAELYHIGDKSIYDGNRYETPVSNQYLEETRFRYIPPTKDAHAKVTMHNSGTLYADETRQALDDPSTQSGSVTTSLEQNLLSSGIRAVPEILSPQVQPSVEHHHTATDVITAIAMVALERYAVIEDREQVRRRLRPFEIRLVRTPRKFFANQIEEESSGGPSRSSQSTPVSSSLHSPRSPSRAHVEEVSSSESDEDT